MLRSTGFFRGIDCPFYSENYNGKLGKNGCNRPYCHFRHSKHGPASYALQDIRKSKEVLTDPNDQGYDPYNPEVVRPEDQYNGESSSDLATSTGVDLGSMELEQVNRAIEAVRNEVEREKKKLSQIGDQKYEPTSAPVKAGSKTHAQSHQGYDPGSYQMAQASDYNPTPCSSKYTLDSESQGSNSNSMEYVPTAVTKTAVKKPAVPQNSRAVSRSSSPQNSASKSKYTLDNAKPPTDMEYDPLSNFSAKPAMKGNKDRKLSLEGEGQKRRLSTEKAKRATEEEYVPTAKKPRQAHPADAPKYTLSLSESDEESSGTEYRPTSLSRLQRRKSSTESTEENLKKTAGRAVASLPKHQRNQDYKPDYSSSDGDGEDFKTQDGGKEATERIGQPKTSKTERAKKEEKDSSRKSDKKNSSGGDQSVKRLNQDGTKKDKGHTKNTEEKNKLKEKSTENVRKEGKEAKIGDGKSAKAERLKGDHGHREKEKMKSDSKKPKTTDKGEKESSKSKDQRNGKHDSGGREKEKKRSSQGGGGTGGGGSSSSNSSKERSKKSSSGLESRGANPEKTKQRSLSHVDLFGDESGEEDDQLVRKSASAFKRGSLINNKRKASEVTASSSEDGGSEHDREDRDADEDDDDVDVDEGGVDYSRLQDEMGYDSDPMEECLRIFNESRDVKTEDKGRQAKQKEPEEDKETESTLTTLFPGQKKRVSHFKAKGSTETTRNPVALPQRRLTAQEICYQRMRIAQQQAAQLAEAVKTATPAVSPASSFPGEKRRVAHRPNALASSKPGLADSKKSGSQGLASTKAASGQLSVRAHTSAGILSKTTSTAVQKRVAHTPTLKSSSMKRPVIPAEFGAKVPTNIRQRYLNIFIDECLKFCPSEEVAFQMALDEEKVVYDRSSSKNIYLNVAVNTLKKLRSKSSASPSPKTKSPVTAVNRKAQSHEDVLGGRLAAKTSFTVNRTGKQQELELRGANLYRKLKEYVMTEEQLQEHGYPRPHPDRPGRALIYNVPEKKNPDPFCKVCCRCGAEYKINANGSCVRKEECHHHWGRLRRYRVPGGWETQYNCCSGSVGSLGCQVAKQHVQDGRKESLDGYVKTFSKSLPADGNGGVYALDCEMCYTKQGLELTRVTVINSDLKVIYDTFVKPESKIVDYNTRFSGVTEEDLENTTITLRDVQAVLLNMFSAESILIGHSLESDLFALKLLHSTIVDTAIVFPHRLGLPYKRALRNLMADYLKRIIQDNVEGHDSSEDASACMELMMWKIREDAKVKR
ncbi:RNA exonuclease 1 homolog [Chanos chanos]|uniref:RNA exonuclease 1 homolog n=1 Tax=Chanos chanos TaxID=29144 RepID=A0A6J2W4T2_CHACN|nr:RNA exonuclease 1 homolog [Chanos chanos]